MKGDTNKSKLIKVNKGRQFNVLTQSYKHFNTLHTLKALPLLVSKLLPILVRNLTILSI